MGLEDAKDYNSNLKDVAGRLFHNSDVTEARGAHAVHMATLQHAASISTIITAREVVFGFQNAVDKMNRNFTLRLNEIIRVERECKELI